MQFKAKMSSTPRFKQLSDFNVEECLELNNRLDSISYVQMFDRELETIKTSLAQEDDKALTDALNWCSEVFDYNVKDGKKIRGIALMKSYLAHGYDLKDDSYFQYDQGEWKSAVILAWCIEILQAFFLVCDDIMDHSAMRRGKPCWYTKPNVGFCAVNDSLLLQCGVYKLLEVHCGQLKCYNDLVHEFLKVTNKTVHGQALDMLANSPNEGPQFSNFTREKYEAIVKYKTSNYTYCLPVHLGMHLAGKSSAEDFKLATALCLKIGLYFQVQDDYLDCFGDSSVTGKVGNDIREGKCTWFAVKFLELATEEQRELFEDVYGTDNDICVGKVMELYKSVSILEHFEGFEKEVESEISSLLESMDVLKRGLFYNLYGQIKKRVK